MWKGRGHSISQLGLAVLPNLTPFFSSYGEWCYTEGRGITIIIESKFKRPLQMQTFIFFFFFLFGEGGGWGVTHLWAISVDRRTHTHLLTLLRWEGASPYRWRSCWSCTPKTEGLGNGTGRKMRLTLKEKRSWLDLSLPAVHSASDTNITWPGPH